MKRDVDVAAEMKKEAASYISRSLKKASEAAGAERNYKLIKTTNWLQHEIGQQTRPSKIYCTHTWKGGGGGPTPLIWPWAKSPPS